MSSLLAVNYLGFVYGIYFLFCFSNLWPFFVDDFVNDGRLSDFFGDYDSLWSSCLSSCWGRCFYVLLKLLLFSALGYLYFTSLCYPYYYDFYFMYIYFSATIAPAYNLYTYFSTLTNCFLYFNLTKFNTNVVNYPKCTVSPLMILCNCLLNRLNYSVKWPSSLNMDWRVFVILVSMI